MPSESFPKLIRWTVCAFFALIVVAYAFTRPMSDFVEYWTSAHLLVKHQNPYSIPAMLEIQRTAGWKEELPLIPLNPPWTLTFVAPLAGIKSYPVAWLAWFTVMASAIAVGSWMLMELYFKDLRIPEVSDTTTYRCLFAFTFYPSLVCLIFGQIAPLVFLGVAGFVYFQYRSRPALAGIFLSLTLVKPQLVYLVWLSLLVWSVQFRRWKSLVYAFLSLLAISGIVLAIRWQVFPEYWQLARGPYPHLYISGVLAALRRAMVRYDTFWLQFVPLVPGFAWWVWLWKRNSATWSWIERMPALITVSLLTSAWGFLFDQTLLAIPVIAIAGATAKRFGKLPLSLIAMYTALNVTMILLLLTFPPSSFLPAPILLAFLLTSAKYWPNSSQVEAAACPQ